MRLLHVRELYGSAGSASVDLSGDTERYSWGRGTHPQSRPECTTSAFPASASSLRVGAETRASTGNALSPAQPLLTSLSGRLPTIRPLIATIRRSPFFRGRARQGSEAVRPARAIPRLRVGGLRLCVVGQDYAQGDSDPTGARKRTMDGQRLTPAQVEHALAAIEKGHQLKGQQPSARPRSCPAHPDW